ncbi:unnamed protein product [Mytilus coruscus]|uniref:Reverse transcriptase zinc-binding domain-containing protein n=1 Tax=Mytilus coruscus TaxID=42192 RepID=A0A6J8CTR6_MYTCO|nr:unnamed protein product [Mytilus coruscus]
MPGNIHPILRIKHQSPRYSKRVPTKIKLLTGTYILQPLRYKIYKEGTEDHCIACDCKEETLEHLLIECEAWNYLRDPILQTIKNLLTANGGVREEDLTCEMTIQVLIDITKIQKIYSHIWPDVSNRIPIKKATVPHTQCTISTGDEIPSKEKGRLRVGARMGGAARNN